MRDTWIESDCTWLAKWLSEIIFEMGWNTAAPNLDQWFDCNSKFAVIQQCPRLSWDSKNECCERLTVTEIDWTEGSTKQWDASGHLTQGSDIGSIRRGRCKSGYVQPGCYSWSMYWSCVRAILETAESCWKLLKAAESCSSHDFNWYWDAGLDENRWKHHRLHWVTKLFPLDPSPSGQLRSSFMIFALLENCYGQSKGALSNLVELPSPFPSSEVGATVSVSISNCLIQYKNKEKLTITKSMGTR